VLCGVLIYGNTLSAPFQLDEFDHIARNAAVTNLPGMVELFWSQGPWGIVTLDSRYLGFLSFAVNYALHGTEVEGYHIVNISIHVINALLVYWILVLTFRTPGLQDSRLRDYHCRFSLLAAMLFVAHPVQTEAVTYIFQRLASLAALFYLLSVAAYIRSRLSAGRAEAWGFYLLSLLAAANAMKTKEIAFTLPVMLVLYEFFFLSGPRLRRIVRLLPLLGTMLIIPLTLMGPDISLPDLAKDAAAASRGFHGFDRYEYFLTEFRVVMTYVRLLFVPLSQRVIYDYPTFTTLWEPHVLGSLAFHLVVLGGAVYLFHRSRRGTREWRLAAFGIAWFYVALAVESSFIPIPLLIAEYRAYLPSVGYFMAVTSAALVVYRKLRSWRLRHVITVYMLILLVVSSSAAYARNQVWQSNIALWEDTSRKAWRNAKVHYNLALSYERTGLTQKAAELYRLALEMDSSLVRAHVHLGDMAYRDGALHEADNHYRHALGLNPDAGVYYKLGLVLADMGRYGEARRECRNALHLEPAFVEARYLLGMCHMAGGKLDEARREFSEVIRLEPGHRLAHMRIYQVTTALRGEESQTELLKYEAPPQATWAPQ
jgi:tetratricopeptide (TPR) repeat protein